jgi:four helix bundle protein
LTIDNGELTTKENVLKMKSYSFALQTVKVIYQLQDKKREYTLTKQLLRSATSVGANIEEANQAESKADFIHKLSVANKEINETQYWLRLLIDSDILEPNQGHELLKKSTEISKF